jgi:parvulin-like peptidyl-prolyl isomerase
MIPLVLCLVLAGGAAGPATAAAGDAVARLDGVAIPAAALRERIAATREAGGAGTPGELLQDLLNDRLLAAEAERQGLARDPAVIAEADQTRRRLSREAFEAKELGAAVAITDDLLRTLYRASADSVRLNLLRVASREEAQAALARLQAGGRFADEARQSLDEASRLRGGDTGRLVRGQLEAPLAAAAFAAEPGALLGPVEMRLGWAVAQLVERSLGDEADFQAKKPSLAEYAKAQVALQARRHYVDQLRARAKVVVDDAFLKSLGTRLDVTAAEEAHVLATLPSGPLRYRDLVPEIQRLSRGKEGGHFSGASVKTQVAWAEIDRRLLEDDAARHGYGQDAQIAASVERARLDALTRAYAARLRAAAAARAPVAAEVEAAYRSRAAEWAQPGQRRCAHLVVAEARIAEAASKQAAAGEPFAELARTYSRDGTTAQQGGDLGDVSDVQLANLGKTAPALAAALRSAPAGQVVGPVQSPDGFHLLRCEAYRPARTIALPEVREALAAELAARAREAAVAGKIAELRAKVRIEIDDAALAAASR